MCSTQVAPKSACCPPSRKLAGALLPIALKAADITNHVIDVLVTRDFPPGSTIGFRFFNHAVGYNSKYASGVSFVVPSALYAGTFLRLRLDVGFTLLEGVVPGSAGGPILLATSPTQPGIPATLPSCFVYGGCGEPIAAIGFIDGEGGYAVLPTPDILPCQYVLQVPAPLEEGDLYSAISVAEGGTLVPGSWSNAWQVVKWGPPWVHGIDYALHVDLVEASMVIAMNPGQVIPIGFRPYEPSAPGGAALGAEWVLVVIHPIPAGTTMNLHVNDWEGVYAQAYTWSTAKTLCPGTVLDFTGLGTAAPWVSVGQVRPGTDVPGSDVPITSITAYFDFDHPITATYTCSYQGRLPGRLVPGVAIKATPWPDCATLIDCMPKGCRSVCNWPMEALGLNTYACYLAWVCQPVPAFLVNACGPCS